MKIVNNNQFELKNYTNEISDHEIASNNIYAIESFNSQRINNEDLISTKDMGTDFEDIRFDKNDEVRIVYNLLLGPRIGEVVKEILKSKTPDGFSLENKGNEGKTFFIQIKDNDVVLTVPKNESEMKNIEFIKNTIKIQEKLSIKAVKRLAVLERMLPLPGSLFNSQIEYRYSVTGLEVSNNSNNDLLISLIQDKICNHLKKN